MANSLQDQLRKAGLVSKKQVDQTAKKRRKNKQQHRRDKTVVDNQEQQRIAKQQIDKAERDRKLNQQREEKAERKASAIQIKQIIKSHQLSLDGGEITYHFIDKGKVNRLYVTEAIKQQLVSGKMAIVKLGALYKIVPTDVTEKIISRDKFKMARIIIAEEEAPGSDVDDEYSDYQIPDDLTW